MRRWGVRLLLLAAVAAGLWWMATVLLVADPVPVTVFRVERGRVEETVTNSRAGTVKARRRARLSPELGGRVVAVPFDDGDAVRAGDILLRLDDSAQRANLELARRDGDSTRARRTEACLAAELAEREWRRVHELHADGIATEELLDRVDSERQRQAAACEAAEAAVQRSAAAVRVAEAELAKTILKAPFDGVLAEVATEVGEWITPAPPAVPVPPVIDILQPGSIYVSAPLDEADAARVRPGQPVRITLDPYPERQFPGRLVRMAPFVLDVEEQNRTFEVEAEFEDSEFAATLLPGTSADVEVILAATDDVLRIPSYALVEGSRVLVIAGGELVSRSVEVGLRNWEFAEVRSGLREGEAVVVSLDRAEVQAGATATIARTVER